MSRLRLLAAGIALLGLSAPAHACRLRVPLQLDDVQYASTVVVGRIVNYQIIPDRESRRKMLSSSELPQDSHKIYEGPTGILSDYARFDIEVDEVLTGKAGRTIAATWDNSTFAEPKQMLSGPFLIALRDPSAPLPPLRGPSGTILPNRDPQSLTVLQAPCASPFILEAGSADAQKVRAALSASR